MTGVKNKLSTTVAMLGTLSLILILLSGCPVKYPDCENDETCREHSEYCLQGKCQQCRERSNCPDCYQCNSGKCESIPECCSLNTPCQAPKICQSETCQFECTSNSDCSNGEACTNNKCEFIKCISDTDCESAFMCDTNTGDCVMRPIVKECDLEQIRFGFDESKLSSNAKSVLSENKSCLEKRSGSIKIEGHCDERGTDEYNMHLGESRAKAAKKFLERKGIEKSRIKWISMGENSPDDYGHTESAWRKNRRCEFKWQ